MENEVRRIDISAKMMQMGQSLIAEGNKLKDYSISQSGNVLIALSNVILSEEDMFLFSQFSLMFTAKKMIDTDRGYDDSALVRRVMNVMKDKGLLETKPKTKRGPNKKKDD